MKLVPSTFQIHNELKTVCDKLLVVYIIIITQHRKRSAKELRNKNAKRNLN